MREDIVWLWAAVSLRIGPAAQLSPGGGYLGVQKGEPEQRWTLSSRSQADKLPLAGAAGVQ